MMVDALRYEMGAELLEGLGDDFEIKLEPGIGCLPSITSVGMAALLPGAESGLELTNASGKLAVVIESQTLKDRQGRMDFFAKKMPKEFAVLKLAEVLKLGAKRKKELAEAKLIVVTSQEIDSLGEAGDVHADTRRWMDEMLEQLRRAVRILARLGAERYSSSLLTTAICSLDELDPGMVMDAPGLARPWNCILASGLERAARLRDGYVRTTASQLELGGDSGTRVPTRPRLLQS